MSYPYMAYKFLVVDDITAQKAKVDLAPYPKVEAGGTNVTVTEVLQPDQQRCFRVTVDPSVSGIQSLAFAPGGRALTIVDATGTPHTVVIPHTPASDGKHLQAGVVTDCVLNLSMTDGQNITADFSNCVDNITTLEIDANVVRIVTDNNVFQQPLPVSSVSNVTGGHRIATHQSVGATVDINETVTAIAVDPDSGVISYTHGRHAWNTLSTDTQCPLATAFLTWRLDPVRL